MLLRRGMSAACIGRANSAPGVLVPPVAAALADVCGTLYRCSPAWTTSSTSCMPSARLCTGMWVRAWRRASSLRLVRTWLPWRRTMRRLALSQPRARTLRRARSTRHPSPVLCSRHAAPGRRPGLSCLRSVTHPVGRCTSRLCHSRSESRAADSEQQILMRNTCLKTHGSSSFKNVLKRSQPMCSTIHRHRPLVGLRLPMKDAQDSDSSALF